MSHTTPAELGTRLMQQVRGSFILQGTTYTAWCRSQGMDPSLVRQAIYGTWGGPKGRAIRAAVLKAAGVRDSAKAAA
ncbi:hypothetical protein [Achromobacter sp.]|jgi:gp16 family phage-associated protein|uniref:hypothetical protein n=1 Tax=Achromobacter sp. TaxID=134375 RepID=UPI003D008BD5